MSNQEAEDARHQLHQRYERPEEQSSVSEHADITAVIAGLRSRLDTETIQNRVLTSYFR